MAFAVAAVAVLPLGAFFTVRATEKLVAAFGMSKVVGGLFITALMAALPEVFATWVWLKANSSPRQQQALLVIMQ